MRLQVLKSSRADERLIRSKLNVFTLLFYVSVSLVVIGLGMLFQQSNIAKLEDRAQASMAPHAVSQIRHLGAFR